MLFKDFLNKIIQMDRLKVMYWTLESGEVTTIEPKIGAVYFLEEYSFLHELNVSMFTSGSDSKGTYVLAYLSQNS